MSRQEHQISRKIVTFRGDFCDPSCPNLLTYRFGTEYCCRIFSKEIPPHHHMNGGLSLSDELLIVRDPECVKSTMEE
jgi:hypothetical protein